LVSALDLGRSRREREVTIIEDLSFQGFVGAADGDVACRTAPADPRKKRLTALAPATRE
jgi:hypothetical protein